MVKGFAFVVLTALFAGCRPADAGDSERVEWTTMGTVAAVQVRGTSDARDIVSTVKTVFGEIERLLNAHDRESEICSLATLADNEVIERSSPFVRPCYEASFRLERESRGAFSPRWRGPGTLDLGAIAKGYAVDCAVRCLRDSHFTDSLDILVDLGGNLRSASGSWRVGIAGSKRTIMLNDGEACATSGEYHRGKHISDARTHLAVSNDFRSVTVHHRSSAELADGLSTTLFILGRDAGERFLGEHYPDATAYWE